MAKQPSAKKIEQYQAKTEAAIAKKTELQAAQGKPFSVTGAGVVPEKIWTDLKSKAEAK